MGFSRIHIDNVAQDLLLRLVAKYTVRGRTATDVGNSNQEDEAAFIRWLLRVRSINSSGLVFTQATKVAMSGFVNKASTKLNCLASSVSVNKA